MTSYPRAILSDQHCHEWSAFASKATSGVNSRLQLILDDMRRAAQELLAAGGRQMVFAGDLFHTRGSIAPSVFNPTHDTVAEITRMGVEIIAIPGNHDLESKESERLGSAITTLEEIAGFRVIQGPTMVDDMILVPWMSSVAALRDAIKAFSAPARAACELIIHAPVNGVLIGVPDHGFDAGELADFGFRRVFSGHYHNHKDLGRGVYSIGATTHQTWSDIGTKAGFLLVNEDRVDFRASQAPKFIEIDETTPEEELPLIVDGNYVRVRLPSVTAAEERTLRDTLRDLGALGVIINAARKTESARPSGTIAAGASLNKSTADFVKTLGSPREPWLLALCDDILNEAKGLEA